MFIKLLCLAVSVVIGIFGIIELNRIPYKKYSLRENYWRIAFFSTISSLYDIVMFVVIGHIIPPGEYGTGIEILTMIVVLLLYAPACIITSIRLKRRMKQFDDQKYNVSKINALNCSVVFKALFVLIETIWLIEVN